MEFEKRIKGYIATRIPPSYRIIEAYPLSEPWAYARIAEHRDTGEIKYFIDEIPLTYQEQKVYNRIMEVLYWELKPPPTGIDPTEYFASEARRIVLLYRIRLGRTPGISWSKILYYVVRDTVGFGPIDPLMRDPAIEDISCDGVGKPVYVWHRKYEYIPTNLEFTDPEELDSMVVKLAHMAGKHVSVAFPIVDAILPGGHRLALTFRKEVSTQGSTFTIRKFREDPITIIDMLESRTLSPEVAAYLWLLIEHKMTGLIMGVTGAGKTSTLNALATLLRPTLKVVTVEDTPELRLPLENWVQFVSRPSYGIGMEKIGEISLYDLIKVSLRYRPDVIIVGEVRGEEAYVLFQAIATGHGGLTTIHAEHIDAAVKRLTSPPMNIPPSYIPLMNFGLVIKKIVKFEGEGRPRIERRITSIWEIRDYGKYDEVVKWIASEDKFSVRLEESILLKSIAEERGKDMDWIIDELIKRRTVLLWMKARKLRHYKDVAKVIHRYYVRPEAVYRQALEELDNLSKSRSWKSIISN
ncbi:MAG: type II/IV secretion system ATPase subunit [Pyrodictiaceae archaeon]